jgi:hypothetical protein
MTAMVTAISGSLFSNLMMNIYFLTALFDGAVYSQCHLLVRTPRSERAARVVTITLILNP